jgi:hypothetical protein
MKVESKNRVATIHECVYNVDSMSIYWKRG